MFQGCCAFNDASLEREFLERIRAAADKANLWDELTTDWLCLDCELMPWSAKAQEREPLRRVHECVFGVLALESEPVDPRL